MLSAFQWGCIGVGSSMAMLLWLQAYCLAKGRLPWRDDDEIT
jgi:hypothetical protein